jgi:hypothetical protein
MGQKLKSTGQRKMLASICWNVMGNKQQLQWRNKDLSLGQSDSSRPKLFEKETLPDDELKHGQQKLVEAEEKARQKEMERQRILRKCACSECRRVFPGARAKNQRPLCTNASARALWALVCLVAFSQSAS